MYRQTKGFTYKSKKGNFYIIINESLSEEQSLKTLLHELSHIELKHFEKFNEKYESIELSIKQLGL